MCAHVPSACVFKYICVCIKSTVPCVCVCVCERVQGNVCVHVSTLIPITPFFIGNKLVACCMNKLPKSPLLICPTCTPPHFHMPSRTTYPHKSHPTPHPTSHLPQHIIPYPSPHAIPHLTPPVSDTSPPTHTPVLHPVSYPHLTKFTSLTTPNIHANLYHTLCLTPHHFPTYTSCVPLHTPSPPPHITP